MAHQFSHFPDRIDQRERLQLQAADCRALAAGADSPFREQLLELAASIDRYIATLPDSRTAGPKTAAEMDEAVSASSRPYPRSAHR
ncbi:MAG: hypothetical protein AB7E79_09485 [Rhodospirillaceae bacterium]